MKSLFFLGCVAALAGCAEGRPAASDSLAAPIDVQTGAVAESSVTFTIQGGFAKASPVAMTATEPHLALHSRGDQAEIEAARLPLGDVTVPASALPPKGLVLRNLVLSVPATRAEIVRADDDMLAVRATVPLSLDWSMQLDDGSLYPLGRVHTDPVDVEVQVVRDGDHTTATLQASCSGTCWAVDGVATLSDGALYLTADAKVTPAP